MQFSIWRFYSKYLSETEILEELAKMQKEDMYISPKSKNKEYKLRYKQVKDFSVKDLEEAGACETTVLKILRDRKMYHDTTLLYKEWTEEREQYFDQDFSGVNGLVWLEKHGFIQKIKPEYIYAKDLGYCEYAVINGGDHTGRLVCKPYGTDKLISVDDPHLTWSNPKIRITKVDFKKVKVSYTIEQ